jgi:hypothetical protein
MYRPSRQGSHSAVCLKTTKRTPKIIQEEHECTYAVGEPENCEELKYLINTYFQRFKQRLTAYALYLHF